MRVWTTVIGQRLDDAENTRSMLLCAELLRRGHDVTMWTSAWDHIRKEWRTEWRRSGTAGYRRDDGLQIRFMKGCGYRSNVSVRRLVDHWLAARSFAREATRTDAPDAIVASIPDHLTAAAAVNFGRRVGAATIIDVRDKWPDIFVDRMPNAGLAALSSVALLRERRRSAAAMRDADAIVAMMQSMLDWGLERSQRAATWRERVFYLTTSPKNFDLAEPGPAPTEAARKAIAATRARVVFAFVGTFNRTQHPAIVFDALEHPSCRAQLEAANVAVIVAGDGPGADDLRRRAQALPNVHLTGWASADDMNALLAASDVGLLVLNFPSPAFNNKAFAYLASGLPIINAATGDLGQMIDADGLGRNVPAGDAAALGAAMLDLARNETVRKQFAANVRRVFVERFDRESNYRNYVDHIERIVESRRTNPAERGA